MGLTQNPDGTYTYTPDEPGGGKADPNFKNPYDPQSYDDAARRNLVTNAGYQYADQTGPIGPMGVSRSQGAGAIVIDPATGRTTTEGALLNSIINPAPRQARQRVEQNGVYYEEVSPGNWEPIKGIPAQAVSASSGAATALGYAQLARQAEQDKAQIDKWTRDAAQVDENLKFLREKQVYAEKNDLRTDARATAAQIATQQYQRDTLNENIRQAQVRTQEAQQQRELDTQQFNSTGQQRAAEFNATNERQTQQANMEYADRRDQRLQQVNKDIGVLGQDAGSRGQFAAYATANRGWGQDNTGIGQGENFITNESVGPLEQSLQNRQTIQNSPSNPYTFTPIAFNPLGGGGASGPLSAQQPVSPQAGAGILAANAWNAANPTRSAVEGTVEGNPAPHPAFDLAGLIAGNTSQLTSQGYQQAPAMEDGGASVDQRVLEMLAQVLGMEPKAIAGEKGKANGETVMSNGDVVVIPDKGKLAKGMKKMATGGLNLDPSFLSTGFLTEASKKARAGTPYADGRALPSPVYASSPGFDPDVASFMDSIRALEQGVPTGYSQRLTAKYRPQGMREASVGRTA